jgi:2-amino-4-hydroxy-6-hydroxymethyldihydropteridine diphosphokinase
MNKTYLLLGSNMGDSEHYLAEAEANIAREVGSVLRSSGQYATAAWGKTDQPDFLNQVLLVGTHLSAEKTMHTLLNIETAMGRIRTEKNAPRIIDIDILFFNDAVIHQPELTIPHKEIPNRRFVLVPLNELAPQLVHPVLKKTIHELLRDCADKLPVEKK